MPDSKKQCFVVMGFGKKTDLATGRKLDLDKSYQALIKPVVEAKGITCVRADEILHSGSIDMAMYQQLLTADVVIADLSTANPNAFYELGIRHALRPRTTIIMSEDQLNYPFDVNHILINKYTHLGENIDYFEVLRFQKHLGDTLDAVLDSDNPDSPVYTYIQDLIPPALKNQAEAMARRVNEALANSQPEVADGQNSDPENQTLALLVRQGEEAISNKQYERAKVFFRSAVELVSNDQNNSFGSNYAYLIQRLALATHRAQTPTLVDALKEANVLLDKLDLSHTNDSETVVLAGAVEKKLYECGQGEEHLADALLYFQRAYYLLHNRYNGINLAYLLNCRAKSNLEMTEEESLADRVWAKRTRREVLAMCEREWQLLEQANQGVWLPDEQSRQLSQAHEVQRNEQKFWIQVNRAEAYLGLGAREQYEHYRRQAEAVPHEPWMMESFTQQIYKLEELL